MGSRSQMLTDGQSILQGVSGASRFPQALRRSRWASLQADRVTQSHIEGSRGQRMIVCAKHARMVWVNMAKQL